VRILAELDLWLMARLSAYELRYSEDQPREDNGQFGSDGGGDSSGDGGYGAIVDTYGPTVDEWSPMADENSMIAVHENGDISVSFESSGSSDLEVWGDFDAETAQDLSDRTVVMEAEASSYDKSSPDATEVSDNGLVDWTTQGNTLVGYTPDEEVAIGWAKNESPSTDTLNDWDMHYLSTDEAQDFADFLGQAAETSGEITD